MRLQGLQNALPGGLLGLGFLGVGTQALQAFARLADDGLVASRLARQTLQSCVARDAFGGGVTHRGDAVVAGLADQGRFVVEPGQGGQAQLLVVARLGERHEQVMVFQRVDQGEALIQGRSVGDAAAQQLAEPGPEFGIVVRLQPRKKQGGIVELGECLAPDRGILVACQLFEGLVVGRLALIELGDGHVANAGVAMSPAWREKTAEESRHDPACIPVLDVLNAWQSECDDAPVVPSLRY